MGGDSYVYSQAWERERARLGGLSAQFDATTERHLTTLGVQPGWRCWEVGAGAGSIAHWLADAVGPAGSVLATDLDVRFLDDLPPPVQVRQHDLVGEPWPDGEFDLVHARAVLEHVTGRGRVLRRLATSLRPGGVLLLEDVVFGGTHWALTQPMLAPAATGALLGKAMNAVAAGFRAVGADPEYGLLLPERLLDAGLVDVGAELFTALVRGDSEAAQFYRLSLAELGERFVQAGLLDRGELVPIDELMCSDDTHWPSIGLVSAWGRRR